MEKTEGLLLKLKTAIINGDYGKSGERFISIRELADREDISYSLAYKIFHLLAEEYLLLLVKQIWYLTYGVASKHSPLRKLATEPTVGIHIKEINNPYVGSVVSNIKKTLSYRGVRTIIQTSENDPQEELSILQYFVRTGCIGVINFPSTSDDFPHFYRSYPLPLIFIGRTIYLTEKDYMPCVLSDNYGISKSIARKFVAQGFKNFYYIGLSTLPDEKNERLIGFRDGINETLLFQEENLFKPNYTDDGAFKRFCQNLVAQSSRENPSLVFCVNDLYAAKIVNNLIACNADIPASVSIVGYDNLSVCSYSTPTISSVAYSFADIAKHAVDLLFSIHTRDAQKNQQVIIPNYLIHRATTRLPLDKG